ncbi:glycosyltransferase family 4 protein [Gloeothece verrucosa]|uniref:Glycosyl transferase group 1 n=1 Tax=Gloeothece verrucosa (strain PCC 7822) TaxID=497965 RepID=E0UDJ6_GLOV7|nr:glycosyltransferase family 4 protein [Gloeothece verrucosa]ADN15309.1 glycosyl transferase group 1 [Gloeothece verrucosa PCC 7822]
MYSTDKSKKFLLIAPSYACLDTTGGGQRTLLIYQSLLVLGKVDVVIVGKGYLPFLKKFFPDANSINLIEHLERGQFGKWRWVRPLSPKLVDQIATVFGERSIEYQADPQVLSLVTDLINKNNYDFIVGRYLRPTARSGVFNQNTIPILLDIDDLDDSVFRSRLNQPNLNPLLRPLITRQLRQIEEIMPPLIEKCKHIWVTNENDARRINHPSVSLLPNIPYQFSISNLVVPSFKQSNSPVILFVGTYGHRVNREAMLRFVKHCWPKIHGVVAQAKLRIVGSGGWEKIESVIGQIPGVEVVGFVENLAEEYEQCTFTIVPIFEGGGTKIKVVESLFYGRTAIITSHAHNGYETLQNGEYLLVAENETEFINHCIQLLKEPELCIKMAEKGQAKVVKEYSTNGFQSIIKETLNTVNNGVPSELIKTQ